MGRTRSPHWLGVLFLFALAACADGPAIEGDVAVQIPHAEAPLARQIEFATDVPAVVAITISNGEREWTLPSPPEPRTSHAFPIVGLRAGTRHAVRIDLRAEDGRERQRAAVLEIETEPLPGPDQFPPLATAARAPDRMEPGLTLFSAIRWLPSAEDLENGWLVVVDAAGEVVWYYRAAHRVVDVRRTAGGTFLYLYNEGLVEIDGLGNVLAHWHASGLGREVPEGALTVPTDVLHHQVEVQPSGEILTLGTELRRIEGYPKELSGRNAPTETANVVGDVVLLMSRDGSLSGEWRLLDILDPHRVTYGSLGRFWDREGYAGLPGGTRDWAHANGAVVDPRDGNVVVTLRHQDAAVKFDRDGQLMWILGDHAGWGERFRPYLLEPVGELEWPYHLHAPQITEAGHLMVFDNGNFRAIAPAPPASDAESYSRVVEFAIDEEAMTVRQVWVYGGRDREGEMSYAPFMGDADRLPRTGNVLITDGGRIVDPRGAPVNDVIGGRKWGRILEVTDGGEPEVLFELVLDAGEDAPGITGWTIYQADRIESLR